MLHRPASDRPVPVVLLLHGFTAGKTETRRLFVQAARHLSREGVASLRFDFRGCGDSAGEFHEMTVSGMVEDVAAARAWLAAQPGLDPGRYGLLGMSLGGLVAALAAAAEPPPLGLLLWSPVTNPRRMIAQRTTAENERQMGQGGIADLNGWPVGRDFVLEMMKVDPLAALEKTSAPVHVLHGDADQTVPFEDSVAAVRTLQWAGRAATLQRIAGAGHGFESLAWIEELLGQSTAWWQRIFAAGAGEVR